MGTLEGKGIVKSQCPICLQQVWRKDLRRDEQLAACVQALAPLFCEQGHALLQAPGDAPQVQADTDATGEQQSDAAWAKMDAVTAPQHVASATRVAKHSPSVESPAAEKTAANVPLQSSLACATAGDGSAPCSGSKPPGSASRCADTSSTAAAEAGTGAVSTAQQVSGQQRKSKASAQSLSATDIFVSSDQRAMPPPPPPPPPRKGRLKAAQKRDSKTSALTRTSKQAAANAHVRHPTSGAVAAVESSQLEPNWLSEQVESQGCQTLPADTQDITALWPSMFQVVPSSALPTISDQHAGNSGKAAVKHPVQADEAAPVSKAVDSKPLGKYVIHLLFQSKMCHSHTSSSSKTWCQVRTYCL